MVNTYAVQSGGCRFESLWGFGFFLKGAHYEVDYSGKKTYLAGLQCTLTSSCAKILNITVPEMPKELLETISLAENIQKRYFVFFSSEVAECRKTIIVLELEKDLNQN